MTMPCVYLGSVAVDKVAQRYDSLHVSGVECRHGRFQARQGRGIAPDAVVGLVGELDISQDAEHSQGRGWGRDQD